MLRRNSEILTMFHLLTLVMIACPFRKLFEVVAYNLYIILYVLHRSNSILKIVSMYYICLKEDIMKGQNKTSLVTKYLILSLLLCSYWETLRKLSQTSSGIKKAVL